MRATLSARRRAALLARGDRLNSPPAARRFPRLPPAARWSLVFLSALLMTTLTHLARPMISYRALEIGVPGGWLGLFVVSYALLPIVIAVPTGRAVDRYGQAPVCVTGAVIMIIACGGFSLGVPDVVALLALNALMGVGQLLLIVGQQAYVARAASRNRLDATFGYYMVIVSAGQAIGPLLGAALGGAGQVPDTARAFAGATVLAVALLLATIATAAARPSAVGSDSAAPHAADAPPEPAPARAERGPVGTVMHTPGMAGVMVASIVTTSTTELLVVYLPALGTELGLSSGLVGMLLSLRAVAAMASRFLTGPLVGRFGRKHVLGGSILLSAVSLAVLPLPLPVAALAGLMVLAGAGLAIGPPLTMAWLTDAVAPTIQGTAISVRMVGNRLGQTVVPLAAALLAAQFGTAGVFWMVAAALGGCLVPIGRLRHGVDRPRSTS